MTLTKLRTAAASSLAAAGLLISLAACSTPAATPEASTAPAATAATSASADPAAPCDGVKVIVDATALKQDATSTCVPVDGETLASEVLAKAEVKTEGTTTYPTELVCRVNGIPAADMDIKHSAGTYREECKDMPAAFAYWALWTKPAAGEWGYAQEGLATLKVNPGESLELLYTLDGAPAAPTA
ncbi:hypothetical protein V1638_09200 [Pseudarthrobacter sp. J64]|uniref:hypothetical protein n=1 Tax=Pseudarthrobacter sp. J64 TaxID=3116485 RepID=UPI002E812B5E|nr:hypothetical protein [Pseudarthrobacter sp. J64]MEE2569571.1 hypothetical protein [Pseudarthrobacter sp. J64]